MSTTPRTLRAVVGHERQTTLLRRAIASDRVGGGYLFAGVPGLGKKTVAAAFAAALNCLASADDACGACGSCRRAADGNHPDIAFIRPDGATLRIAQIRELQRLISLRPSEGRYKVYVVTDAEKMRPEAANALLKTLEEPPGSGVLVLTTRSIDVMLPTIRSRCQELRFLPLPLDDAVAGLVGRGVDPQRARALALRSRGRIGSAIAMLGQDTLTAEGAPSPIADSAPMHAFRLAAEWQADPAKLDTLLSWYHDLLLLCTAPSAPLEHAEHVHALRALAKRETYASVRAKMLAVMDASYRLRRNISAPLALETLALQLVETPLTSPWGRASLL